MLEQGVVFPMERELKALNEGKCLVAGGLARDWDEHRAMTAATTAEGNLTNSV